MRHATSLTTARSGRATARNPWLAVLSAAALLVAVGGRTTSAAAVFAESPQWAATELARHHNGAAEGLQRRHRHRHHGMLPVGGFGGSANEWLRDINTAPVAADSATLVANLAQQVASRYNGVAAFNYSA